ncbi:MAG: glycosyltransferase, partial [Isosphaeraceae bacterium]
QVATTARWERQARWPTMGSSKARLSKIMSQATHRLDRLGCRSVDHVMVENAVMRTQVRAWGQSNVSLCPPGVDTQTFHPRDGGWNRNGDILSVGRLAEERKRFDRLLDSYAIALRTAPDLPTLRLVGRGQLPEPLRRRIAELGIQSRVLVESDLSPSQICIRLREASIFLQASSEEGLGIAVLEAMASGIPVVATDTAGTRETVVDGVTGRLVAQTDTVVRDLAAALVAVWSADGGTQGREGRERVVRSFSTTVTLDRFWSIHEALGAAHLPGRSR